MHLIKVKTKLALKSPEIERNQQQNQQTKPKNRTKYGQNNKKNKNNQIKGVTTAAATTTSKRREERSRNSNNGPKMLYQLSKATTRIRLKRQKAVPQHCWLWSLALLAAFTLKVSKRLETAKKYDSGWLNSSQNVGLISCQFLLFLMITLFGF